MFQTEKKESTSLSSLETKNPSKSNKLKLFKINSLENKFLQKKMFKIRTKKYVKNKETKNVNIRRGYWNKTEHNKFIEALYLYNCDWLKIHAYLKNRTYKQVRSHAQKFYLKLKSFKDEELGLDFTSPYVKDLNDIIVIIKKKELNSANCEKLLYIISEKISFGKKPGKKEHNLNNFDNKNVNINYNYINNNYINYNYINNNYINNNYINYYYIYNNYIYNNYIYNNYINCNYNNHVNKNNFEN